MKTSLLRPVLPFLALPLLTASALGQTTGVAHPDSDSDTTIQTQAGTDHYVKPTHAATSEAVQASTQTTASTPATEPQSYPATASSYPATGPASAAPVTREMAPAEPTLSERRPLPPVSISGSAATCAPVQTAHADEGRRELDGDDGIVLAAPDRAHELHAGTILRVRLDQTVSTEETPVGTRFSAQLLSAAGHSGEIMLPAGSTVLGRVTKVHGGKRITGAASLRLQPDTVNLPDGTSYHLAATVSGLEGYTDSKVNGEGTIIAKTHPEVDVAALGLTTGAAAVTGAVVGGGVGAAVGAGIGAGVGTYLWLNREHQETLPSGTGLLLSLDEPLQVSPR